MKTRIFKTIFPVMAFMIAIAGAFAFSSVPEKDSKAVAQVLGHYKVNGVCESAIMCQDDVNTGACQFGTIPLYKKLSNTSCANPLWRIVE
jgi:hypothetical protein